MTDTDRTYRTEGGNQDRVINFPATRIREIPATIKRIVTTDEGKIQIVLEGAVTNNEELEKVRDLVMVQQLPVTVDILGRQGEMDL